MEKTRWSGMDQGVVGGAGLPDPAVSEKPVRRRFTAEYKIRMLREADRCTQPGQLGALLRREGLYSSHLTTWRHQRDAGALAGLAPKRRGRKPTADDPLLAERHRDVADIQRLGLGLLPPQGRDRSKRRSAKAGIGQTTVQVSAPAELTSRRLYVGPEERVRRRLGDDTAR